MTIEKKLEKRIKTIVQTTGDYPKEIEITKEEYKQLNREYQEKGKFQGVKLKIKE